MPSDAFVAFRDAILRRLFHRTAPPAPSPLPLGLSRDQAESLLALQAHPGWAHYRRALEALAAQQASPLLSGVRDHEEYLFQAGVLAAIRRIHDLPALLSLHLKAHDDRTAARADAALTGSDLAGFTNTLWYDLARRESAADVRGGRPGLGAGENPR